MRGGPLTEPMRATHRTFLTKRERQDPENAVKGPSLLLRRTLVDRGYDRKAVTAAIEKARHTKRTVAPELDVQAEALPHQQPLSLTAQTLYTLNFLLYFQKQAQYPDVQPTL